MEPLPRLPGLYFEAPPQPVASVLPRMDIAAFVGLAVSGPLDLPVAVEDAGRFRDVFGSAPALAWDGERGRLRRAHLGSAVDSFFANGGRRCWVVRVAGPGALRHRFSVPGLESSAGERAVARARAVGSWCEGLTVGTALTRDPVPLLHHGDEHPVEIGVTGSPARPSYRLDLVLPATGLAPGDLLEVTFGPEQPRLWLAVGHGQSVRGGLRVWGGLPSDSAEDSPGFWLEPGATSPSVAEDGDEEAELVRIDEQDGLDFAHAWLGSPPDPERLPSVRRLSFEILVWRGSGLIRRLGDLTFDRRHPRFWAALLTDEELFGGEPISDDPYRVLREEAGAPRFPFAGPEPADALYLPRSMGRRRDPGQSEGPEGSLPGTPLERDGLDSFGAELFLDPRLAGLGRGSLAGEAEHLGLVRKLPLLGLHSLLGIEEATLVAVPDAVHRGWSRQAPPARDLLGAPHLDPLPEPDRAGRYPLTWSTVDGASGYQLQRDEDPDFPHPVSVETEDPDAAVTLPPGCPDDVWFRVRARRHGEAGPWSNTRGATLPTPVFEDCAREIPGGFKLRLEVVSPASPVEALLVWEPEDSESSPPETFELEESSNTAFEGPRGLYSGSETSFELPEHRDGVRYYRVRGLAGGRPWPWSNTVTVPAELLAAWVETSAEEFDDGDLLATHRALLRFCAARADLVALLSLPDHYREDDARSHIGRLTPGGEEGGSSNGGAVFTGSGAARVPPLTRGETPVLGFGALYHPWLTVREEVGDREAEDPSTRERTATSATTRTAATGSAVPSLVTLPPDGAAAGVLARLALERGAWIAPANRPFTDTLAVVPAFGLETWGRLTAARVNVLTRNPRGFLTLGADTLSGEEALRPVHVRRLLILLRKVALEEGRRFVFHNNSPGFRDLVRHRFERVLGDLFRRGAFAGASEQTAFRVTVDESVNPPASIERGLLVVELAVAPARELAFVTIRLLAGDGRLTVEEG
jgi:hypothetical protein